ncbi:MAG: ImmA/IrrE family metallo-endopeptidase [Xanthobacteraceae bacterium]
MTLSRIELDAKGAGSPEGLVARILKVEPNLPIPVPLQRICRELDIVEIRPLETAGFEGGLIADTERSEGVILVKDGHRFRQRFTIAHELGHFLIPAHMPDTPGRFLCSREDLQLLTPKENDRRSQMEVEANRFASLILMPPPELRKRLSKQTPDLQHVVKLAGEFEVSKQAMSRAYADHHEEPVAIIVIQNGKILWSYRNRIRFPFIRLGSGEAVPRESLYHRAKHELNVASEFSECLPDNWIDLKRGERAPELFEQVYLQKDGYALILLHLVRPDEDEETEQKDLEHSWQVGFKRRR